MEQCIRSSTSVFRLLCCCCCCWCWIFSASASPARFTQVDIINQTCAECAQHSRAFSYAFCSASLSPIPVAHFSNVQGLAIVSMELALQNATGTASTIEALLEDESLDSHTTSCLRDCLELYRGAVPRLVDSIGAFMDGQYKTAGVWVSGVMEAATTCEDGFREREEEPSSPLTTENQSLFQLCGIALCIVHLITVDSSVSKYI